MQFISHITHNFQYSDETATYILEPISTNEFVSNDDPNIMWIQVKLAVTPVSLTRGNNIELCRRPSRLSRSPRTWVRT